nr:hypothetical protein ZEAMMB73_Zm00001d021824 [Ipomoea batatas]
MSGREHIEDELSLSYGVSAHSHLQKPIPQKLTPPLPILIFPAPSRPADRQDIVNLPPEKAVLHRVPARVVARQQRAERGYHGRGDLPEEPHGFPVRPGGVVEGMVEPVHGDGVSSPDFQRGDIVDLSELFPDREVHGGSEPGHLEMRRWALHARGEDVEERGPLEALHDVEIDDVDARVAVNRLEDGLVGGEMSEFYERGDVVEDLEGGMESFEVHQWRADSQPRIDNSTRHGVGEIRHYSLGAGRAVRGRHLRQLKEHPVSFAQIIDGNRHRTFQEETY